MAASKDDYETCLSLSNRLGYAGQKRLKKLRTRAQSLAITTFARTEESHTDALLSWLRTLSPTQRQSAVSIQDSWFTSTLRQMFMRKVHQGEVIFKFQEEDAKTDCGNLDSNFYNRIRSATQAMEPSIALEVSAEQQLEKALRISDTEMYLDTLTVDNALLGEVDAFIDVMKIISGGKAFRAPCRARFDGKARIWFFESPNWLFSTFNSLARWAGAWLERGIWMNYWKASGKDPRSEGEATPYVWEPEISSLYECSELTECWSDIKVTLRNRLVEEAIDRGLDYQHRMSPSYAASSKPMSFANCLQAAGNGYEQYQGLIGYYNQADSLHELRDKIESGPLAYLDFLLCSSLDRAMSLLDFIARSLAMDLRNLQSRKCAESLLQTEPKKHHKQKRCKKSRKMSDISSTSASLSSYEEEDAQSWVKSVIDTLVEEVFFCALSAPVPVVKSTDSWPFKRIEGKKVIEIAKQQVQASSKKRKKKRKAHKTKSYPESQNPFPYLFSLHREIEVFFLETQKLVCSQRDSLSFILQRVSLISADLFPASSVSEFGSRTLGLALPSSDLDLVVVTESENSALYLLADALQGQSWVQKTVVIDTASVPIVKLDTCVFGQILPVDISFRKGAVACEDRLREVLLTHPSLTPLVLVVKQILLTHDMHSAYRGYLSSYSLIIWMAAFLQNDGGRNRNLGEILLNFFQFYSTNFNPETTGVAISTDSRPFFPLLEEGTAYAVTLDPLRPGNNTTWNAYNLREVLMLFKMCAEVIARGEGVGLLQQLFAVQN